MGEAREVVELSRDGFMRIIRVYFKVVKEIVLSDNLLIDHSEQIRKMNPGEVIEVYQGPVSEPSVNVLRVHGRALKDGAVGWATISGNQGVTFLVPGGNVMKVLRTCPLTEGDLAGVMRIVKMLPEGELLEVMDWSRTSTSALGVTRLKVKVRSDGLVGWVQMIDDAGTSCLEAI